MRAIAPELMDLQGVAAAVLAPDGTLLEANAGFARLLGPGPGQSIGTNVSRLFVAPDFRALASLPARADGTLCAGPLKLVDTNGQAHELAGRAWRSAFGLCVLAEFAVAGASPASEQRGARDAESGARVVEGSLTDPLTGVGNRDHLQGSLATEISRVQRTNLPLSALLAGLDGMGGINERHGKAAGDAVLARFGFLLRLLTRPTDISSRIADDRFVVLMPHTNLSQATRIAERIRKALSADRIEPLADLATASFGVAEFQAGDDSAAFLARLESAAAEAKAAGRNKVNASEPM